MKKIFAWMLVVVGFAALSLTCAAKEQTQASDITQGSVLFISGTADRIELLRDGSEATSVWFENGGSITLENTQKTAAIYLVWDFPPESWQVQIDDKEVSMGQSRYLHQYAELPAELGTVKLSFDGPALLCEIRQLTKGTPPPGIQNWQQPCKDADMLLLPTHADDEHLYFGGTIPTYTARGKAVQVAYLVNHGKEPYRQHELLNGLWTAGIRNYPIIPAFSDQYSPSLEHAKTIYDPEAVLAYQVELIRRFQPEVIVGHDINGEYGHGAHRLNSTTLQQAVVAAADTGLFPDSLLKHGPWDTPKTYLHLWAENVVVMDWNQPLAAFGGATAFETATEAFACHASQWDYFKVEQTGLYDCRKFGLFRSIVGADVEKKDFFEHIEQQDTL